MAKLMFMKLFIIETVLFGSILCEGTFDRLCSRLYFQHQRETVTPYANLLNGVYVKTKKIVDNFPVFKYERGNAYFQYSSSRNIFYFSVGKEGFANFAGVVTVANSSMMEKPALWTKNINNYTNIFGSVLITRWAEIGLKNKRAKFTQIKPKCVSFTDCQSENIIFTVNVTDKSGRVINDLTTHYFYILPNVFRNNRQVYRHSNQKLSHWYLFYVNSGNWIIGPDFSVAIGYWSVKDNALKPEFITNTWRWFDSGKWTPDQSARFQCQGMNTKCSKDLCSSGVCQTNLLDRAVCTCPVGKSGRTCRATEKTCDSNALFLVINRAHGSVAALICPGQFKYKVVQCRSNRLGQQYWNGFFCNVKPKTTQPSPRQPKKYVKINIDKDVPLWVQTLLYIIVPSIALLSPYCHHHWGWFGTEQSTYGLVRLYSIHSYVASLVIWLPLILINMSSLRQYGKEFFSTFNTIALVFFPLSYLTVLFETCCDKAAGYIGENIEDKDVYFTSLIETSPRITVWVECYHMETRTRLVYYTDAQGYSQSRIETYQELVVTWRGSEEFQYQSWIDCSDMKKITKLNPAKMTRVKLNLGILFADAETQNEFRDKKEQFIDDNEHRDERVSFGVNYEVEGFKERLTLYGNGDKQPCWMNKCFYRVIVGLYLSWPYRLLLKVISAKEELSFVKRVSIKHEITTNFVMHDSVEDVETTSPYTEKVN